MVSSLALLLDLSSFCLITYYLVSSRFLLCPLLPCTNYNISDCENIPSTPRPTALEAQVGLGGWLTNTTRTAAYAAVAKMTSFLPADVQKPTQAANATTNPVTVASFPTMLSPSRQSAHIAPTRNKTANTMPTKVTNFCSLCSSI